MDLHIRNPGLSMDCMQRALAQDITCHDRSTLSNQKTRGYKSTMAVDMFIKINTVDGEAQDPKHKKEIDVLSWLRGMSNSGSAFVGGGTGGGKVNVPQSDQGAAGTAIPMAWDIAANENN